MDFLRDPLWQFIGVIVALIAIFLTIAQRSRKEIVYEVVSDTPILSVRGEIKDQIQVLYKGKPLADARLIILRVWNLGNTPISLNDYVEPINFDFGQKAEILDADIL